MSNHFDIEKRPFRISIDIAGYNGDEIARAQRKKQAERKARKKQAEHEKAQRVAAAVKVERQIEAMKVADDLDQLNASLLNHSELLGSSAQIH